MALRGFLSAVAIYGILANAIPSITFPLNSQVPPVARVSEPFSYTLSVSTFSSTLPITYTLSSGPRWLSLDSNTRTLLGVPTIEDAGTGAVTGVAIDITASDSSGSITQNATLVVSKNPRPMVSIPISAQLQSFAAFSAPSTLLYHPSTPFTFNFQPGTFSENGGSSRLSYYAVTVDNTPLPSWISFDGSSLTFTGQTPNYQSLIQPPQTFGMQLIASDVEGFTGTSINFDIEVGVHLLAFKNASLAINANAGDTINFDDLATNLELDGQTANSSLVVSITAQTPPWLAFDNSTLALSGTVPNDATPYNITVQATDIYGDTANAIVCIDVYTSLFNKQIGTLNGTIGLSFAYDMSVYLQNKSDINMNAQFSPPESWLSFDSQNFILAGQVPLTTKPSTINITLLATSSSSHDSGSQSFTLLLASAINQPSPSALLPSSISKAPVTSQTGNLTASSANSSKHLSRRIILAIVIPIIALLICPLLALFCYMRRRRTAKRHSATPSKSEISAPLEASSSVIEIVRPPYVELSKPLELDMTGFGADTSSITTSEQRTSPKKARKQDVRRSQTLSVMSGTQQSQCRESDTSGNRAGLHSGNALFKSDSSWRSTQDSVYPTVASSRANSSNAQRLTRNYSNYSRKGHTRCSATLFSTNPILTLAESSSSSQPAEDSILNLRDSNFSFPPMERFSVINKHGSTQQAPELSYASNRLSCTKSTKKQSRFMPTLNRPLSGIGHGGRRDSISSLSGINGKRRGVGHGQDWTSGQGLARNSKTWLTIGSSDLDEQNRRSTVSALSEYAEMKPEDIVRLSTIRQVTKTPSIPLSACLSASREKSRNSRPVSRRVDSSPFFGGSAYTKSRRSPKKVRTSYADSPTVPEEDTMSGNMDSVLHGVREKDDQIPRDSFGISYGLAREGTRKLRSFVQSQLSRSRTRSSIRSNESKDSRFKSASGSMMSLHQFQVQQAAENQSGVDEYEGYLPEDYSEEGSWETHHSVRDNQGNVIEYHTEDFPKVVEVAAQSKTKVSLIPIPLKSNPNSPPLDMGPNMRMVLGASRRPISVDAKANKRASKAKIERGDLDYTAYI